ncbi:hypothetical protein [Actinacidiphila acididurans]|uniref:HNH endonuclease n=1 Tax=Actinacidiphila acididurans TaxID=2784346 RepID=A0ABS2U2Z4_9ACTN|nr:hypothetical protein [Actinacidiphila acididurans]MBM9509965.1 hypothetical protein [Actinacidiphila acididurans]
MHDPLTVAFEIRRPWPRPDAWTTGLAARTGVRWQHRGAYSVVAGRGLYWPPLITVWHRDPSGYDDATCGAGRGRAWMWHIHHWRIQVPPLQEFRRRLLTRCAWCGERSTKADPVNVSHQYDRKRSHWWQGEPGLFHSDCSAIKAAHAACICDQPILDGDGDGYGHCAHCGRYRAYGTTPERLARMRELAAIPTGGRRPATD